MKKLFSGLLAALMCVPLLFISACGGAAVEPSGVSPAPTVSAAAEYDGENACRITFSGSSAQISGEGASAAGALVTISAPGTYLVSGESGQGQLWVTCDKEERVTLVLAGLELASADSSPLVIEHGLVTLVLDEGTENSLTDASGYSLTVTSDESNVDGAIFAKDDLTVTGSGTLAVRGNYKHGVVCKDSLTISGGVLNVESAEDGFQANDGITVSGGDITINAGDDGMHSDDFLTVTGGSIDVQSSYEGLEGANITISGGEISIVASDDGLNAAGGADGSGGAWSMAGDATKSILIEGGALTIDAGGDGVDSNGSLTVTGGETYVSGPVNSANGALDYGTQASISGGIFMAVGASGMAASFGESSTQGSIMANLSGEAGAVLSLRDESGNTLCSFTPTKAYGNAVISCPGIADGGTYSLCSGETELASVTMDGLRYAEGGMGGFGGGMGGHGGWDGQTPPEGFTQPEGTPPEGFTGGKGQRPEAAAASADSGSGI